MHSTDVGPCLIYFFRSPQLFNAFLIYLHLEPDVTPSSLVYR